MSTTKIKTRIQHKHDTAANWASSDLVPLEGELIVYDTTPPQIKIGDGTTAVGGLPFIKAGSDTVISAALTSGTKIGSITIDGVATILYAPSTIAWGNVTSKPSYYDGKAITSITRSGTTFTATYLDGTTSTFTQQDNNTTYTFTNKAATLAWNTTTTIATVGGVDITVKLPVNPDTNTTYSAGTGITLSGTTFSLNVSGAQSALGLGSNAYTSIAYLPLSGGLLTGQLQFNGYELPSTSPVAQHIFINGIGNDSTVKNAPGIGFHIGNLNWGTLKFQSDGSFRFYNNTLESYMPIYGSAVYGAVWNDYAEFRRAPELPAPGRAVVETGDGTMVRATERLQPGAKLVSDTFGFAIGETDECKTPIAVSGRVLAYPLEDRESYQPGDAVCTGPNGTVSRMTREEICEYPERIIGTVSEIPLILLGVLGTWKLMDESGFM